MTRKTWISSFKYFRSVRTGIVILLLGGAIGYGMRDGWFTIKGDSGWVAVSAIATFFAGVVALGVACFGFYMQRSEKIHQARISAASVYPTLEAIRDTLETLLVGQFDDMSHEINAKVGISALWSVENLSFAEISSYAHINPYYASLLADSKSRIIHLLRIHAVPTMHTAPFDCAGFVHSIKNEENSFILKAVSDNVKLIADNLSAVRYKNK